MRLRLLIFLGLLINLSAIAQVPNISYPTPQNYIINTTISPLPPTNTGGAVPATIYGQVTTFAGSGVQGSNNGTGTTASFNHPARGAFDANGNLYITDRDNYLIRKITPSGVVSTYAGNGAVGSTGGALLSSSFNQSNGIAIDGLGNIYITDAASNLIRMITSAGVVSIFAGSGNPALLDGTGTSASFYFPYGDALDAAGNIYIADTFNNSIRKITPAGVVTTIAGNGTSGLTNGNGSVATFYNPNCVFLDNKTGTIYVSDAINYTVRKIDALGNVTTFVGSGTQGTSNGIGKNASFGAIGGVTMDAAGYLYVADLGNNLIRRVDATGLVTTLAGTGVAGANNGISTVATFKQPNDVEALAGYLYVIDYGNNLIRKICLTGYTIDKNLPTGLTFDPTTGIITGTPTVTSPATVYTVTAYNAAGSSTTTVTISVLGGQTVTYSSTLTKNYGDADFPPGATASSGLPVTYSSSNPAVAIVTAGGTIHIVGAGTTVITASQPGNATYLPAVPVTQTLTVLPAPLTISAPIAVSRVYGAPNPAFVVTYTGFVNGETSANLTTQPTVSTTATVSSLPGTYPITVTGAVDPNYTITYVPGVLTVTVAQRTLTFNPIPAQTYGNPDFDPGATIDSGDPIIYTSSNPAVAIIVNGKIHIVGAGTVTITATVANRPGYVNVTPISQTLVINKAPQIITFATIPTQTLGGPAITLTATSNSGLPVTLSSSDPTIASINGFALQPVGLGTTSVTATQPGDNNYLPATAVIQTVTVISLGTITAASNIVPNTFTPNNDGFNDNWEIPFLANYPNCTVKVFSRRGQLVFSSVNGYPVPWDGKYNNLPLPVGAYYYVIDTKDVLGILSGTVNLVK